MKKLFKISLAATATFTALIAQAAPCDDNFSATGSFLTGKTYKSFATVSNVDSGNAFEGALSDVAREPSWKILRSDKTRGTIEAVQLDAYTKGKTIPFNITVEAVGNGAKISTSYATPIGTNSPDGAIKKQFCKTIDAAAAYVAPVATVAASIATKPEAPIAKMPVSQIVEAAAAKSNEATTIPDSEYVKSGMPCLGGVCIGDGIDALLKIKWKPITKNPPRDITRDLDLVSKNLKGDVASLLKAGYFSLGSGPFDNEALAKLSKINASCLGFSTKGEFVTASGAPVTVEISFTPNADNSKQTLSVVNIYRRLPNDISNMQANDLFAESNRRYGQFGANSSNKFFGKEGHVMYTFMNNTISLQLARPLNTYDKLKMHTLCGGTAKISID